MIDPAREPVEIHLAGARPRPAAGRRPVPSAADRDAAFADFAEGLRRDGGHVSTQADQARVTRAAAQEIAEQLRALDQQRTRLSALLDALGAEADRG